jgi:hypothetical protein
VDDGKDILEPQLLLVDGKIPIHFATTFHVPSSVEKSLNVASPCLNVLHQAASRWKIPFARSRQDLSFVYIADIPKFQPRA